MSPIRVTVEADVALAIATLDSATATTYNALRDLGLTADAARDAIDAHILDTIATCRTQRDELPAGEDDDTGGVRTR